LNSESTVGLVGAIKDVLREHMSSSPAVRRLIAELARTVLSEIEQIEADLAVHSKAAEPTDLPGYFGRTDEGSDSAPDRCTVDERGVVPLRLGDTTLDIEVSGSRTELEAVSALVRDDVEPIPSFNDYVDVDLELITARCRLKAESCRFFIERRAHEHDPTREWDLVRRINEMIARGKALPSCFLWVFWKEARQPADDQLGIIADCYDAVADAAELCRCAVDPAGVFTAAEVESAFELLAEANSALRVALDWTWLSSPDTDQHESHLWLRRETSERMIYVERHMTLGDPADPYDVGDVRERVQQITQVIKTRQARGKEVDALFNKARYHARRLKGTQSPDLHDCGKVNEVIDVLLALNVRHDDGRFSELRDLLSLVEFPPGLLKHALLKKSATLSTRPENAEEIVQPRSWSKHVKQARVLLEGSSIVVIGGERRPEAIDRFVDAFGLEGVEWVGLTEHGTSAPMQAPIQRSSTRVVLVLVRLCGHLHAESARRYAREADKPLVMLPAGYNPEQVAKQLLDQAGERLVVVE